MRADHQGGRRAEQEHDRDEQESDQRGATHARVVRAQGRPARRVQDAAAQTSRALLLLSHATATPATTATTTNAATATTSIRRPAAAAAAAATAQHVQHVHERLLLEPVDDEQPELSEHSRRRRHNHHAQHKHRQRVHAQSAATAGRHRQLPQRQSAKQHEQPERQLALVRIGSQLSTPAAAAAAATAAIRATTTSRHCQQTAEHCPPGASIDLHCHPNTTTTTLQHIHLECCRQDNRRCPERHEHTAC